MNTRTQQSSSEMHPKKDQIRALGQRSIPSSFIFRSSSIDKDSKQDPQKKDFNKGTTISLSDFRDRKLPKTNTSLPKNKLKGKLRPFSSPFGARDDEKCAAGHQIGVKNEQERNSVIDEVVFAQFKFTDGENGDGNGLCIDGENGTSSPLFGAGICGEEAGDSKLNYDAQLARKRKNPFEGRHDKDTTQKHSLALGGDLEPKRNGKEESLRRFTCNKRPKPLYNHYANGSGWWDCDMEGVDSEEVGYGEIWEGVGSTTFGGIEWHQFCFNVIMFIW